MNISQKGYNKLEQYVKKRFADANADYKTFDLIAEMDSSLSYEENKAQIEYKLNELLGFQMPKLRKDTAISDEYIEHFTIQGIKEIQIQAKLEFEKQLEVIANTNTSDLLNKIYYVPKEYIKMVVNGKSRGLLLYGEGGLGKSWNVKRVIKEAGLKEGEDYNFISGHITPLQFYKKLFENRNNLIILDDINILENKINLNMLKACLNDVNGFVEYHTTNALKNTPSSFLFKGRIIILLNEKPEKSEHLKAVESRILTYPLEMDYQTKISIIFDIAKNDYEGLTTTERQEIVSWIKENTNEATKNLSIRLLFMCFEFYKWDRVNWVELANSYIKTDEYLSLIVQGVGEQAWCERTGLSRPTYFRYKKQLVSKYH